MDQNAIAIRCFMYDMAQCGIKDRFGRAMNEIHEFNVISSSFRPEMTLRSRCSISSCIIEKKVLLIVVQTWQRYLMESPVLYPTNQLSS